MAPDTAPSTPSKGAATRELILDHAYLMARRDGIEGLSIGALALAVGMSKSGVFAHFGSREDLQLALLDAVSNRFVEYIKLPALKQPRGMKRLRALIDRWIEWGHIHQDGCVLLSAAVEYDGHANGPLRERVLKQQTDWRNELKRAITLCIDVGDLKKDSDADQLAFEIYALMLVLHHDAGLFGFEQANRRTVASLDRLFASYQS
jgi:AcrR family transcriptional regulator